MINYCDRGITLLRVTFGLFNLFTLICFFSDNNLYSKCKRNFEDIFNRTQDIYSNHQDE